MGYDQDLMIDQYSLDREWIQQPRLYMTYAEKAAEADRVRKKAKEKLDVLWAELDTAIRIAANDSGEKITEKIVESRIKINDDYKKCLAEFSDAEYDYNIISAAVRAFEQKKSALENLVKLYIAGYFSTPIQEPGTDEVVDVSKAKSEKQTEEMNKRREERRKKRNQNDADNVE